MATSTMPVKGDRVRFEVSGKSATELVGIVDRFEERGEVVGIRGEDWQFFRRIDATAFAPGGDGIHTAEVIPAESDA